MKYDLLVAIFCLFFGLYAAKEQKAICRVGLGTGQFFNETVTGLITFTRNVKADGGIKVLYDLQGFPGNGSEEIDFFVSEYRVNRSHNECHRHPDSNATVFEHFASEKVNKTLLTQQGVIQSVKFGKKESIVGYILVLKDGERPLGCCVITAGAAQWVVNTLLLAASLLFCRIY